MGIKLQLPDILKESIILNHIVVGDEFILMHEWSNSIVSIRTVKQYSLVHQL